MKNNIKILDCTLRDGGFVNDWRFGNLTIRSIVSRLDSAGIDIIECGFLDSRVTYDKDRSMFPDMPSIEKTLGHSVPKQAMLVAMIDFGTYEKERLLSKEKSVLGGIRLIFKKEEVDEALAYGKHIQQLGYHLFINPVALTSYKDLELTQLIDKISECKPYGMSIVDTYGLMFDSELAKYIDIIDAALHQEITLGYHAHNNLQMANAHCVSYISKELHRAKVVDSSVLGMGKNAGNACTELLCSYVEKKHIKPVDLSQILECAYTDIRTFHVQSNWGYGLDNLLSAIHDCSPNWIKFLMNKNTLSIQGIRAILDSLPFEKREVSYFSKELAEQKYLDYMDKYVDDRKARRSLQEEVKGREALLLCPGKTLKTHQKDIEKYIAEKEPIIFTVNFLTDMMESDYAFISNPNRYSLMQGVFPELHTKPQVLLTSNITPTDAPRPDLTFNYKTLYERIRGDNSAGLLMVLLQQTGVERITIAGMDGFDEEDIGDSFFDINMRLGRSDSANQMLLAQMRRAAEGGTPIQWITPSKIKGALQSSD